MSRPSTRRPTHGTPSSRSVTVSRAASSSPEDAKKSIRLTVKMPANKLRAATGGTAADRRSHNIFTDPVIVNGPRNSRSKRKIVEVDSDDDEDGEESAEAEEAQSAESEEEPESEEDEADAEADPDVDADGDIDMDEVNQGGPQPTVTVTPAAAAKARNVDAKSTNAGEEDEEDEEGEELSELESEREGEDGTVAPEEVEVEEEGEEEDEGEGEGEEEELSGSESGTPAVASRASTPDVSKMTKRQRGRVDLGGDFLQLPMEPQVKKQLTAEEHAMRRAEMARRRKNLSEKRNEEEKMDTINKLLKKQAPKRRGKISAAETAGDATPGIQEPEEVEKAEPTMIRYVFDHDGCRLGMPEEWAGTPAGGVLNKPGTMLSGPRGMKLVQEIS